jgi:hypothetical protein
MFQSLLSAPSAARHRGSIVPFSHLILRVAWVSIAVSACFRYRP